VNIEYIKNKIEQGYTLKQLSSELKCGYSTIRKLCKKNGVNTNTIRLNKKYPEQILRKLVFECMSYTELFKKLNVTQSGGSYQRVKQKLKDFNIDVSHFDGKKIAIQKMNSTNSSKFSIRLDRREPRRKLLKLIGNSFPYECLECKNVEWRGKKLKLHIDHIDGNRCNNILSNLRFLCPNCHSQKKIDYNKF
jgi:5-methylcytosine-specific restriction endonuclease McrA